MAEENFEVPELGEFVEIPAIEEGATAHLSPYPAAPEHQRELGFPGQLIDDWVPPCGGGWEGGAARSDAFPRKRSRRTKPKMDPKTPCRNT